MFCTGQLSEPCTHFSCKGSLFLAVCCLLRTFSGFSGFQVFQVFQVVLPLAKKPTLQLLDMSFTRPKQTWCYSCLGYQSSMVFFDHLWLKSSIQCSKQGVEGVKIPVATKTPTIEHFWNTPATLRKTLESPRKSLDP